jgi:hypothetical protein
LQIINWSKHHNSKLTISHVIKLATRRLSQTSGYSYSRVATIRIDVQPTGEIQPTRHTLFTLSPRMVHDQTYLMWSTYSNLSYSRQQIWTDLLHPRRRALDTIHSTTAVRSVSPYPASLPQQSKSSGKKSTSIDNRLLGLPGPYHRHAIGTFNTCSRGSIEQSLIDTGGGYNLEGAGLPHTHSPIFPTRFPHFPLMTLSGLHFNHIFAKDQSVEILKNLRPSRGLSTTRPSTVAYIYD